MPHRSRYRVRAARDLTWERGDDSALRSAVRLLADALEAEVVRREALEAEVDRLRGATWEGRLRRWLRRLPGGQPVIRHLEDPGDP